MRGDLLEGLTEEERELAMVRLARRIEAERIAKEFGVDAGDVDHVLFNLTLTPEERLTRGFRRGGLYAT